MNLIILYLATGIAAEAIQFGKAEGGASDEQSLVGFLTAIQPPFSVQRVKGQAQWAAMQVFLLYLFYMPSTFFCHFILCSYP